MNHHAVVGVRDVVLDVVVCKMRLERVGEGEGEYLK